MNHTYKTIFIGILSIILFPLSSLTAQITIVEEKYEKKNEPLSFKYLPNSERFVIFKGKTVSTIGIVTPTVPVVTTSAYSYDKNGNKLTLFENEQFINCTFSGTENSFKANDASKSISKGDYKYFLNNTSRLIKRDLLDNIDSNYFGRFNLNNVLEVNNRLTKQSSFYLFPASFNDFYDFGFINQDRKREEKIDLEKDDLYLETIEIKTNIKKKIKLEKPDLTLLKGDALSNSKEKIKFVCRLNGNNNFDLITKSLSSDSQTTILYKTTYDFEGKKLRVVPFTLKLADNYFILSNNNGGPIHKETTNNIESYMNRSSWITLDILSINNYYEDRKNGDIYVYGLFSNKVSKNKIDPKGFYIFKFDKDGNKIWESVNNIDDKDFFEKIHSSGKLQVSLLEYNKNLIFSVSVDDFTEFSNSALIDKSTGNVLKTTKIEYNNFTANARNRAFISNTYRTKDLKNKSLSQISFVALDINPNVLKYLKSIPSKGNRIYFETVFSDQGIWLVETDNKEYYKVSLFKE